MTRKPYRSPRIIRYPTPAGRIEEYAVSTGTNITKCTVRGTCSGGRGAALPEWMAE